MGQFVESVFCGAVEIAAGVEDQPMGSLFGWIGKNIKIMQNGLGVTVSCSQLENSAGTWLSPAQYCGSVNVAALIQDDSGERLKAVSCALKVEKDFLRPGARRLWNQLKHGAAISGAARVGSTVNVAEAIEG